MDLSSSAFEADQPIPTHFTRDGADVSPPLAWSGAPDGTLELALICDDPDAPRDEPWVHWVIYGLAAERTDLPEGVPTTERLPELGGARQGRNDFGDLGYGGPSPPRGHGTHHYQFALYALDTSVDLAPGASKGDLLAAIEGHVLARGELVGTYER